MTFDLFLPPQSIYMYVHEPSAHPISPPNLPFHPLTRTATPCGPARPPPPTTPPPLPPSPPPMKYRGSAPLSPPPPHPHSFSPLLRCQRRRRRTSEIAPACVRCCCRCPQLHPTTAPIEGRRRWFRPSLLFHPSPSCCCYCCCQRPSSVVPKTGLRGKGG